MMPGGHLATALALSATAYAATGSIAVAAGCFAGGFLIDFDHYLDYLVFEKQWRRPSPLQFLEYYFNYSPRRFVLPLHSFELMTLLFGAILWHPIPILVGYWFGAAMHLTFDVLVNGEYALRRTVLFYVFAYRASQRFAAGRLAVRVVIPASVPIRPVQDFFRWRPTCSRRDATEHADPEGTVCREKT